MSTIPAWIQKENDKKTEAERKAETAQQKQMQVAKYIHQHGLGFWKELGDSMKANALAVEQLKGAELYGACSLSVTGQEHNIYVRIERRSVSRGPEAAWMNLWYIPGNGSIRCWYLDRKRPNIELVVVGRPDVAQDIRAQFTGKPPLNADQLAEAIIRQMVAQAGEIQI